MQELADYISWSGRSVAVMYFLFKDCVEDAELIEMKELILWYWGRIYVLSNNTAELYYALPEQLHIYLPTKEGEVVQDLRDTRIFNIIYERCITNIIKGV